MLTSAFAPIPLSCSCSCSTYVGDLRAHVRVHARGQRPLVLAELGQHVARRASPGSPGRAARRSSPICSLVRAVDVRVDQRDGQRLDARLDEVADDRPRPAPRRPATTVLPRASIRSTASRVSASEAGGSGLIMMIQPASGPGVCERARWRICLKPVRRDQADARALRLEHRVRRDRRAVQDVAQVADARCRPPRRSAARR